MQRIQLACRLDDDQVWDELIERGLTGTPGLIGTERIPANVVLVDADGTTFEMVLVEGEDNIAFMVVTETQLMERTGHPYLFRLEDYDVKQPV